MEYPEIRNGLRTAALCLALLALCSPLLGHKVSSVSLISYIDTDAKTYVLDAAMEVIPSEEQALNDQIPPEEAARQFAEEFLIVLFDEEEISSELSIRIETSSDEGTPEELQRREVLVKMSGLIPEGAEDFLLYLDPSCPMAVVMVVVKDQQASRRMQVILAGEYSRPVNVQPLLAGDPFVASEVEPVVPPPASTPTSKVQEGENGFLAGWSGVFGGSLLLPLVPVGVLLLTTAGRAVIAQMAVLLIGLSLSLSSAAWGLVGGGIPASRILGGLLALLCLEAIIHRRVRWWRFLVLAVTGVVAGLVLANSGEFRRLFTDVGEVNLGKVVGYVAGAELALVAAGLVSAVVLLVFSRFDWYRKSVVQPLAVLIMGYGIFEVVAELF